MRTNYTIYTAIFGDYDQLKEPLFVTSGWKYVCYTDNSNLKSKNWEIIYINKPVEDPQRAARYVKINFHEFLDSEYSIWIDASFIIACDLNEWWKRFKEPFTCVPNPFRNCVYLEAVACNKNKRDYSEIIFNQVDRYHKIGVPSHNGMIASGLLMRQKTKEVIDFCEDWWEEIKNGSVRDQIAWGYVSWKRPIFNITQWDYRKKENFIYMGHTKRKVVV